ncbi:sodium ABC transporter ATP-binding protein [Paenibacillus selenitireducens]|uniref:Sodium ABC transporter ATP-binding protein n=1 Tax=Paenibacillus selenitireducens TaxID=1324314 RepID=A0A1T2X6V8_9BACL|nr:ABC transporter ATP-binding protein [Paenibacillus selenitireducens]OPA75614.1 sodium ABC transporter ATP-binding protein [Paenibacillus selenitireducens]
MNPLKLEQVVKEYGDKRAVNQINIEVGRGEIYGLLGANGAGKTTTMRMVLGLIYPDQGNIFYNGKAYSQELNSKMGYLPEERGLYPKVKINEQLIYLAQLRGMTRKDADQSLKYWLDRFNVPEYYDKKIEELSKGNQQKMQFIAAVIHRPQIIIMDEAFSGLDPVNVELLKETVKEVRDEGASILFSTHRMEHVEELCQNVTILHRSNTVLQGNLKDIKRNYPREQVVLGTEGAVNGLDGIPGVTSVDRTEIGYRIGIANEQAAQQILTTAMQQSTVQRFEIVEPTLNQIFIKAVGERHE